MIEPRVHLRPDESFRGHLNVLRGYIAPLFAGRRQGRRRLRRQLPARTAVGERAAHALRPAHRRAAGAVIDAAGLTDMRTGAVTALGARELARPGRGARPHRRARHGLWNVRLLAHLFELDEIRVHSRRPESREAFGRAARARPRASRHRLPTTGSPSVRGADIVVEAAAARAARADAAPPSGSSPARWWCPTAR